MTFKTMFTLNAVIAGCFGLALIAAPGLTVSLYGVQPAEGIVYIARLFGAVLVTLAVLSWSAREIRDAFMRRAITGAMLSGDAIGLAAALLGQIAGVVNAFGWLNVIVYLVLTAGYAYFVVVRSPSPVAHSTT